MLNTEYPQFHRSQRRPGSPRFPARADTRETAPKCPPHPAYRSGTPHYRNSIASDFGRFFQRQWPKRQEVPHSSYLTLNLSSSGIGTALHAPQTHYRVKKFGWLNKLFSFLNTSLHKGANMLPTMPSHFNLALPLWCVMNILLWHFYQLQFTSGDRQLLSEPWTLI